MKSVPFPNPDTAIAAVLSGALQNKNHPSATADGTALLACPVGRFHQRWSQLCETITTPSWSLRLRALTRLAGSGRACLRPRLSRGDAIDAICRLSSEKSAWCEWLASVVLR